jgi:site-specific DNA recombinase
MLIPQNGDRAGFYFRLSRDEDSAKESNSITNQRKILTAYAEEHHFKVIDEYIDDGVSGTTFDRPGFNRMIEDA